MRLLPLALLAACAETKDSAGHAGTPVSCAAGWPSVADPVYVSVDGLPDGDGSDTDPVDTLAAALAITRASATREIAVGPGTFEGGLELGEEADGAGTTDDGLVVQGCAGETTVSAPSGEDPVIRVGSRAEVALADLVLSGGSRSLWAWQEAALELDAVTIADSEGVGAIFAGASVQATDLSVTGAAGYGVAVQGASLDWSGGGVTGATGVGVLLHGDGTDVSLDGLEVADTEAGDELLGRGVQAQDYASLAAADVRLSGNADTAIMVVRSVLTATRLSVEGVGAATLGDGTETGDGIVLSQGSDGKGLVDPSAFASTIHDSLAISACDRAAIVAADVVVDLADNVASSDNGLTMDGTSFFLQGVATNIGTDPTYTLDAASALTFDDVAVSVEALTAP